MKINKQGSVYTIIYIAVVVSVVGALLALTSKSLKSLQQENEDADKMKQILASVHVVPAKGEEIKDIYEKYIVKEYVVDADGNIVDGDAFDINVAAQSKITDDAKRKLPVYECNLGDKGVKYILPAYGAGLWGPIWGYIAVDSDGSTVYGAYFSHQGETPGLGAEIEKPSFSKQFEQKHLFVDSVYMPIQVVKKGQHPTEKCDYVNGVSGGTITSKGVSAMLSNCLKPYEKFLLKIAASNGKQ